MTSPFRSLRASLLLLCFPALYASYAIALLRAQGPYWGGRLTDPSYTYLLNALRLATLSPPAHVDHPGTPVQILGAFVLRLMHPLASNTALVTAVFDAPEVHAQAIGRILVGLAVLSCFLAGLWVMLRTDRLSAALLVQAGTFLVASNLDAYSGIRPEPLLLVWSQWWVAIWIVWAESKLDLERRGTLLFVSLIGAAGVATKITFAPLLVIPLLLLPTFRARGRFLALTGAAFLLFIAPALVHLRYMASWVYHLAARTDIYGRGAVGLTPKQGWGTAFSDVLAENPAFFTGLALGAVTLAGLRIWRRRPTATSRSEQLLLATLVALGFATLMVMKQSWGSKRYLVSAAAVMPLIVYSVWCAAHLHLTIRSVRIGSAVLALAVASFWTYTARHELTTATTAHQASEAATAWIHRELRNATVMPSYGASSLTLALDDPLGLKPEWRPMLKRRYPDALNFGLWDGSVHRDFQLDASEPPPGDFFVRVKPLETGFWLDARHALKWDFEAVWTSPYEAIYRVRPPLNGSAR